MTKKIDSKGRITIPKKIRKQLKLKPNQTLKIRNEKNSIILTKWHYLKREKNRVFLLFICIYTSYICKKLNNKPWGDWVWDKGEVYRKKE